MTQQLSRKQRGGSLVGNLLLLALFAYGVYVAIQYVPQYLESRTLDSVLQSIEQQHQSHRFENAGQVEQAIRNNLNMNQMDGMIKHTRVREYSPGISIEISYDRELDLVFKKKTLAYNKTADLE